MLKKRKENFNFLYDFFKQYEQFFILPRAIAKADPCWFGFPITIRDGSPFTRREITRFFEDQKIETRTVFAGNIVQQPAMKRVNYRTAAALTNSDKILKDTFFLGVGPHLTPKHNAYMSEVAVKFLQSFTS